MRCRRDAELAERTRARKVERFASADARRDAGDEVDDVSDGVIARDRPLRRLRAPVIGAPRATTAAAPDSSSGSRPPASPPRVAELSKLAHVRERSQDTVDITGTYRSARARVDRAARRARAVCCAHSAGATTQAQIESLRGAAARQRPRAASARSAR